MIWVGLSWTSFLFLTGLTYASVWAGGWLAWDGPSQDGAFLPHGSLSIQHASLDLLSWQRSGLKTGTVSLLPKQISRPVQI